MASQHTKGTINVAEGIVRKNIGKLTGNKKLEVKGEVQQVQGKAQKGVGTVQGVVHGTRSDHR
jgi:uncharacterized protein YjbJ (UPF0337 family)